MQPQKRGVIILFAGLIVIAIGISLTLSTRNSRNAEDKTQTVDRNGSVETGLSVIHADSAHDVILTTYKVWIHDTAYATFAHRDTVPALDSMNTEAGNDNDDTRTIRVKRDYQLFITVK